MGAVISNLKKFITKNWNYIIAFLIPWILIIIHSVIRQSWLTGQGSILAEDAGNIYYQLYAELWNKIHQGGSLFYTWNSGLGTDFLVQIFQYLMSPFTLVVLLFPKNGIADMLQFIMVIRWSLAAVAMTYYFMHTRCNRLVNHKKLLGLGLASCYFLSNAMIQGMAHMNCGDVLILFPLALLLVEKLPEGFGYKRLYVCLTAIILFNFRLAVPVILFLLLWYFLQLEGNIRNSKTASLKLIVCFVSAVLTGMFVMLPCASMTISGSKLYAGMSAGKFAKTFLVSAVDFVQRFYACDLLNIAQAGQPVLYLSVTALAVALLFFGIPMRTKKKIFTIMLLILLTIGLCFGGGSLLWHGFAAADYYTADMSFLLSFLILYMAMEVLQNLDKLKIIHIFAVLAAGVCVFAYVFFKIEVYLDFYVYLATLLLYVFILLLLFFYCRKSIKYHNILVVFFLLCMAELLVNAYIQLGTYNMYPIEESYYHKAGEALAENARSSSSERLAATQITDNYGMVYNVPLASGQLAYTNENMQRLFENLGMSGTETSYEYFGGSPLMNLMFHIRYGMSQQEVAFSDVEKKGENDEYNLYSMKRLAGLGYMADREVGNWETEQISPFEAQNAFVKQAVHEEPIFETVVPEEFSCKSLLGGSNLKHEEEHDHSAHADEEANPVTVVEFDEAKQQYMYQFIKMYVEDIVTASFESDGVSDYYVYVKSDEPADYSVTLDDEVLYSDLISSKSKTFHIGVVKKGTVISIGTNAAIDDLAQDTLTFQIAAFQEDVYSRVYEKLSKNCFSIDKYGDNEINGSIQAEQEGIMLTSIPAAGGWKAYVDGDPAEWNTVGGALIAIPMEKGEHEVELRYATPYMAAGVIVSLIGILSFAVGSLFIKQKKEE